MGRLVVGQLSGVVSGPRVMDLSELKRHIVYDRGFRPSHPTVQVGREEGPTYLYLPHGGGHGR